MNDAWPQIGYSDALAAWEAGQKLRAGGRTFLVRQAMRNPDERLVLWVTDERTLGDQGLLLFPDGRIQAK